MKTSYGGSPIGIFERLPLRILNHPYRPVRESIGNIDGLTESIRQHGLLEPIVVRPVGETFEVIAGNRRLEACRRLHMKNIPCHVVVMDDATSFQMALVENIQRENMNPMEEAEAFKRYVDDYGYGGISQLAGMIGKSESYVSRRLALLQMPDSVTERIKDGRLSVMIAQELIPVPKDDAESLAKLANEMRLSRDEVRSLVRNSKSPNRAVPRSEWGDETMMKSHLRVLNKAAVTLRVSLMRIDSIIDNLEEDDDWILVEILTDYRHGIHMLMDRLIRLEARSRRLARKSVVHSVTKRGGDHGRHQEDSS